MKSKEEKLDEEYLNQEFPKGKTKFRGQAMVLLALARKEGKSELINQWKSDIADAFDSGKSSAIKIINFYKKSWDEDKDAIFNEGYMENLFNGMLSKLNSQRESSKNEVSVRQNSPPSPLTADSLRGEELKDG